MSVDDSLLAELVPVFKRVDGDRFIYLPTKRLAEGPQAAVDIFSNHVDVYFKFLARCKPKVSLN
jgi:hypothetical protein